MSKVHFVGIRGIGMSGLAGIYQAKGWEVSGSDLQINGHHPDNLPDDVDLVIHSAAVPKGNPELVKARGLDIPVLSYAEALGALTKEYLTIAVSGSHGKSTTTSLLALMLIKAGLDPTVIVGTRLKEFGGKNFRVGKSRYLVIEADEWNNSFHHFYPVIAVVTNIDKEHLDTFGSLRGVIQSFNRYLKNIAPQGKAIVNANDKNTLAAVKDIAASVVLVKFKKNKKWALKIPGEFNQLNAEMAWQAARVLGVKRKKAEAAVKKFCGSWRRLEELRPKSLVSNLQKTTGVKFYSDYGHHPTEIKAVGSALRELYPNKNKVLIFQPHQAERTTRLFKEFTSSFSDFDTVGILPVYKVAGRESSSPQKTSQDLARKIKALYLSEFEESFNIISKNSVVVFMGAGDIDNEVRRYFDSKLLATVAQG